MENSSIQVQDLLALYNISTEDLKLVKNYGKIVIPRMEDYIKAFYVWLEPQAEYREFFSDPDRLLRVSRLQGEYWEVLFQAEIDEDYLRARETLGRVHAEIGLSLPAFFAGMNQSLIVFSEELYDGSLTQKVYAQSLIALAKVIHLDTAMVVKTYTEISQRKLEEQNRAMMEMSTPVTSIWEDVLMLPIVGVLDSKRAQDLMNNVLDKIAGTRSKVIILDISGVAVVDTAVANHIIKITKATKLMGCDCLVSGVSPAIAETIVELGIDVESLSTTSTLRDALESAFGVVGVNFSVVN